MSTDPLCTWDEEEEPQDIARALFSTVQDIENRQRSIHEGHRRHARMYAGYTPLGLLTSDVNGAPRPPNEVTR